MTSERAHSGARGGYADATAAVRAAFARQGVPVLTPERDDRPYDLVVEADGLFVRVAVRATRDADGERDRGPDRDEDRIPAPGRDSAIDPGDGALVPREGWGDYLRGVDYVAVRDAGDVHLLHVEEIGSEEQPPPGETRLEARLARVVG